ncbi:MAG: ABC transporter ATP-binding protein [bacterium]
MNEFILQANNISKKFDRRKPLFENINFTLSNGKAIAITGKNGSGKSTLLKITAGLLSLSSGEIKFEIAQKPVLQENFNVYYGFVAPYLNLYEEFTAPEHMKLHAELKGIDFKQSRAGELLDRFNLSNSKDKYISKFSSGMKQRLKLILAIYNEPPVLFLDEPYSNLDEAGIKIVTDLIIRHKSNGGGIIIATNDEREKALCDEIISLESQ